MTRQRSNRRESVRAGRSGTRGALIAELVATVLVLSSPSWIGDAYVLEIVQQVAIFGMLALGLTLVFGYTGQISLGQAAFFAIGGYTVAILEIRLSVPFFVAWIAAIVVGVLIAWAISVPLLRLQGHYLALGTLALGLIVQTLLIQLAPLTGGPDGIVIPAVTTIGVFLHTYFPYLVVGFMVASYWIVRNVSLSSVGRALRALRDHPAGAAALGINVSRYKAVVFVLAGGISAAAGILYAQKTQVVTPEAFGFDTSIEILLIVVLGGMTSRVGAVVGTIVYIVLPQFLSGLVEAKFFVFALVVLALLLFAPGGIIGLAKLLVDRIRSLRVGAAGTPEDSR